MATLGAGKTASIGIRKQKRADLVAEELKRLITQRNLKPGDKLPQEIKLPLIWSCARAPAGSGHLLDC